MNVQNTSEPVLPESIEDLPRFVEELSLQIEELARHSPERLQDLQLELELRRLRAEQWLSVGGTLWSRMGIAPAVGVIFISVYAGSQDLLGLRSLWWMLAAAFALQSGFTFYVMRVRDRLERDLQLVEFARRQQANAGE